MLNWMERNPMVFLGTIAVGALALMVWAVMSADAADNRKCAEIAALARTSRDTLDARIACEQIKASTAQSISIGIAAGAVAGAAASSAATRR